MADSKVSSLMADAVPLSANDFFYVIKSNQANLTYDSKKISFSDLVEECRKAVYSVEEDIVTPNVRISLITSETDILSFTLENSTFNIFEKIVINRSGNPVTILINNTQAVFVRNFGSATLYYIGDQWTVTSSGGV
jgi:hypothetical protein